MQYTYNCPPEVDSHYENLVVLGKPLPSIIWNKKKGEQIQWQVPCKCKCGRRDLINIQDLKSGKSTQCAVCDEFGFFDSLFIRPGRPGRILEAFGEKKYISDWVKDPRCTCKARASITARLQKGMSAEEAISSPRRVLGKRITDSQAREIYTRANAGEKTINLAMEYGISSGAILLIKRGINHKKVTSRGK